MAEELQLDEFKAPFQPKPFYDSMIPHTYTLRNEVIFSFVFSTIRIWSYDLCFFPASTFSSFYHFVLVLLYNFRMGNTVITREENPCG